MDDLRDDLVRVARGCERAARAFETETDAILGDRLREQIAVAQSAWSGSWIGYQSRIYIRDLRPRQPGDFFDSDMGPGAAYGSTRGDWVLCDAKSVQD